MTRAEIYKLRTHRTPLDVHGRTPHRSPRAVDRDDLVHADRLSVLRRRVHQHVRVARACSSAIVFGGWLLGTEYRQGTVKRLLTSEPRRLRALTTKGLVGAGAMSIVLALVAGVGWTAARVVGSMNDATVPWNGRALLAFIVSAVVAAAIAYSLSAVTRSDSFAMVGTVATILVVGLPLSLVPKVGKYTVFPAITRVEEWVSGNATESLSTLSAGAAVDHARRLARRVPDRRRCPVREPGCLTPGITPSNRVPAHPCDGSRNDIRDARLDRDLLPANTLMSVTWRLDTQSTISEECCPILRGPPTRLPRILGT